MFVVNCNAETLQIIKYETQDVEEKQKIQTTNIENDPPINERLSVLEKRVEECRSLLGIEKS